MASTLPTLAKTWEMVVNNIAGPDDTEIGLQGHQDRRDLIFGIKALMTDGGTFTQPWVVVRSSNSSVADATDNWATVADAIWSDAGNAHSWIVLQNTAVGIYLMIDLIQSGDFHGDELDLLVSRSDFSVGGTTTARPTSPDEMLWVDHTAANNVFSSWGAGGGAGSNRFVYTVQMTTDGHCTRVLIWYNNVPIGFWNIERPIGASALWTNGVVVCTANSASDTSNFVDLPSWVRGFGGDPNRKYYNSPRLTNASGTIPAQVFPVLTSVSQDLATESAVEQAPVHPITGNGVPSPQWWYSDDGSVSGVVGRVTDCWVVPDVAGTPGDTAPAVGAPEFFRHGNLLVPWDGVTVPVLA